MSALPWWAAGACLAAVAVGHWLLDRRPLGVSGVIARFANLPSELAAEREAARAPSGEEALAAALTAATAEALAAGDLTSPSTAGGAEASPSTLGPPAPLAGHAAFLVAICAGGLLARVAGSRVDAMGAVAGHSRGVGVLVLAAGGLLLGFGSGWMGGCTTGHGITGCSRLMPGSLLATAVFLLTAVIVAHLSQGVVPW